MSVTKKRQNRRPCVSVRGETYQQLRDYCNKTGKTMTEVTEDLITQYIDKQLSRS